MRREGICLEKDIMQGQQGTMPGNRKRGRPRTNWLGNIKEWTGLTMEELIRLTEDRRRWRNIVHDAADRRPSKRGWLRTEQNSTLMLVSNNTESSVADFVPVVQTR